MKLLLPFLGFVFIQVHCEVKFGRNWTSSPKLPKSGGNSAAPFKWDSLRRIFSGEDSGKRCLENVEKCIEEDSNYERSANRLGSFVFGFVPPMDLGQVEGVSLLCKKQSEKYVEDLKKFRLWALKMYDSSAKLPSGILNGNVNQLGDFDLCLQAKNPIEEINGKYCLASMQVEVGRTSPYILALHRLTHSHYHFRSQLDDPGHRVPRFSSINWAFCIPSGCSIPDLELVLRTTIDTVTKNTDLQVKIQVESSMCQSSENRQIPSSTVAAACVFGGIVLLAITATIYDYHALGVKNCWILTFSLRKNFNSLCQINRSSDDIQAIHGIRFVNAFLLVLAHKSMAMFFTPYVNRTEMVEFIARPWTVVGRAASLYTDPFILVSGTLTSYSLLGKLKKNGRINIFEEYVSRLFRIVPAFVALIAFCTLVLPWINNGPMWNQVVSHHSEICKKYWWRNLFFIHNYYGFKDMCLTHTHHVGIDTQLFFVSPIFVLLLWRWPRKGAYMLGFIALVSTLMRYYATYSMKLSNYIHFGTSIKQLFETADNMYILPSHRATVYVMGIFLGYVLKNFRNVALTRSQVRIGGTIAFLSFVISFFGPAFMGSIDYKYNPTDAAWYAAFSPILWSFAFAWIIFTNHTGYKGGFERFFSWRPFAFWTKISYTVYLIQFPVFFYNVGVNRTSQHYGFFRVLFNLQEQVWILFLSTILTLLIEMPFQNIRDILFKKKEIKIETLHKKIS